MDRIEYLPNSDLQIPFWSIPPSVRGKISDGVGEYDVSGAVRSYEFQEAVQHLLLVSISSLYAVALFCCGRSNVWIWFNPPSDLVESSDNTLLWLAVLTTLLIGQPSISLMVQGTRKVIQNTLIKNLRIDASIIYCLHSTWISSRLREEKT